MKEEKLENDELDSFSEADARKNSLPQDVYIGNTYDTTPLDFVKQEIDDTLIKPFIGESESNGHECVQNDSKTIVKQIIEENSNNWHREDFIENRENSIAQDINSDNSDPHYTAPVDLVKQESDDIVVKHEPFNPEEISTEFQSDTEDIKPFTNQIIEENGKIWCREDSTETWNNFSMKYEENEDTTIGATTETNLEIQTRNGLIEQKIEKSKCHSDLNDENHETDNFKYECLKPEGNSGSGDCLPILLENSNQLKQNIQECQLCEFIAYQKSDFQKHMNTVHLEKDKTCPFCEYHASRKWLVKQHVNAVHLKLRKYKCHMCDYGASRKNNLQVHINTVHLKLKVHKCHLCEYSASQKSQLNTHIKFVHLNLKKRKRYLYNCHLCDYTVSKKSLVENHLNAVHSISMNYDLAKCDYKELYRTSVQEHKNSGNAQQKNYKCHSCDYIASQRNLLKRHINAVHLKLKNHKCQWCDFSASLKINLQVHINAVHLKLKTHECQWCDYKASLKSTLQEHINAVHLKLMNHKCHLCEFVTSRRSAIRRHIDVVHSNSQKFKC